LSELASGKNDKRQYDRGRAVHDGILFHTDTCLANPNFAAPRECREIQPLQPTLSSSDATPNYAIELAAQNDFATKVQAGVNRTAPRNNPPQYLVRSTGAAMSTTSRHAMTPLNGGDGFSRAHRANSRAPQRTGIPKGIQPSDFIH
jgi:hypothetical protein